jgi:hypothetical protein
VKRRKNKGTASQFEYESNSEKLGIMKPLIETANNVIKPFVYFKNKISEFLMV